MDNKIKIEGMESNNLKKFYEKPQINRIMLVANEAVLALCKFNGGALASSDCEPDVLCVSTRRS